MPPAGLSCRRLFYSRIFFYFFAYFFEILVDKKQIKWYYIVRSLLGSNRMAW